MNPIDQIAELFCNTKNDLFSNMSLEDIMSGDYNVGFTSLDFFSIEPYAEYFHHWPQESCKLFHSVDELESTENGIHIVAMKNSKVVAVKWMLGGGGSYDTAFYTLGDWECRHQIYRNSTDVKPIVIEFLKKDVNGAPIRFITAREYGLKIADYEWSNNALRIVEQSALMPSLGDSPDLKPYMVNRVEFNKEGQVTVIRDITRNGIIYDSRLIELSLEEMLDRACLCIHDKILSDLKQTPIVNTISCFLFEYSEQGPLPPTIALIQPDEITDYPDDYPLAWLSAPDSELFTEEDLDSIILHGENDSLFTTINAEIYKLERKEADEIIVEFYLNLCRQLKSSLNGSGLLNTTDDFFVTAREFSVCNEAVFLEKLWPQERWMPVSKALDEFKVLQEQQMNAYLAEFEERE